MSHPQSAPRTDILCLSARLTVGQASVLFNSTSLRARIICIDLPHLRLIHYPASRKSPLCLCVSVLFPYSHLFFEISLKKCNITIQQKFQTNEIDKDKMP